jgi:tetratricopeptide (TPR) repeat protein
MDRRARRAAEHAEAAACSIREPYWRVEALTRLATTLAAADLDKHAVEAADKAETAARSITNQKKMVTALRLVANALAAVRLYDRAYGIAQSFPQPDDRVHALATLTEALASENLSERAREMACEAEAISRSLSNPYCAVPAAAARALTAAGLYERGRQEASRAEAAARSITHIDEEPGSALAQVVHHLAAAGMHDQAEAITRSITTPYWLTEATVEAAKSLIGAGQQLRAHRLISLALSLEEWRTPELIQVLPPEAAVLATTVFDLPTRPAP